MNYAKHFSTRKTSQSEKIPGTNQVKNDAGGYAWRVDDWMRLNRFLILGTEGGSYYVGEHDLTVDNANAVLNCIQEDGKRVVNRTVEISQKGRAPSNDPALFVLAMCSGLGDKDTKKYALDNLTKVARTGTHLFNFCDFVQEFRGWGRGLRNAIAEWYNSKDPDFLAYQLVKYRQRNGWTHRDVLRKAHVVPKSEEHDRLFNWVCHSPLGLQAIRKLPDIVQGYEKAQIEGAIEVVVKSLIEKYNLTREMIPTQHLNSKRIWSSLLQKMPMTAMIRNLGKMTAIELLQPFTDATRSVVRRLHDKEIIKKARVHPLSLLVALKVYEQGQGMLGNLSWHPVSQIIEALNDAFYLAFENVEATNKNLMLALDVSGSMEGNRINKTPLTARDGAAAMAMATARVEPNVVFTAFSDGLVPLSITANQRLDDVISIIDDLWFSSTDCALPILYAMEHGLDIDTFIVYTDSETWAGDVHPVQALHDYRGKYNHRAKLVVVGMTSDGFSIADPDDAGMLDVVGFNTATPRIISEFVKM